MKLIKKKHKRAAFFAALLSFILLLFLPVLAKTDVGQGSVRASAAGDYIAVHRYDVTMTVCENREILVNEKIDVEFLTSGLTMFYRSFPLEGDQFYNITAKCDGNPDFSYYVKDNPDVEDFLDVNCVGGAQKGKRWTYEIDYTMMISADDVKNGMILDVVGTGWPVPLKNVTVTVNFPSELHSYKVYSGGYGGNAAFDGTIEQSSDGKALVLKTDLLSRVYNSSFGEYMAEGITLRFTLGEGVLQSYTTTRMFTENMWWLIVVAIVGVALTVVAVAFMRTHRELVTVVNIKAPDSMDPMVMGRRLDGVTDTEDVTSMIYYFAEKGYLQIDLSDEDDPVLIKNRDIPTDLPAHQRTLFNGLFSGKTLGTRVPISSLANKYYVAIDKASVQVKGAEIKHYENKSGLGLFLGGLIALALVTLVPLFLSLAKVGGGYCYFLGLISFFPIGVIIFLDTVRQGYRYKWTSGKRTLFFCLQLIIAALWALVYVLALAQHFMTEFELLVTVLGGIACTFIAPRALSRTEKYNESLGQILGFKDFIVHTEEDKIKIMLAEDPQLYYHILPYAQVLGVTDEWTDKFKAITLEPPVWYVGGRMTVFDYMLLNRCMRRATASMISRPRNSGTGRSGGGGSFGGFSGGGHGGGGGGAR